MTGKQLLDNLDTYVMTTDTGFAEVPLFLYIRILVLLKKYESVKPEFLPYRKFGCPKCKSILKLGNPYCWYCGQSLNWE